MDVLGFGEVMLEEMPFEPTDQQIQLTAALARFCSADTPSDSVFILNGYAGTGKTSVMGALVRSLHRVGVHTMLLASTGRAAKVLASFTGFPAHTIHRQIYTSGSFNSDGSPTMAKINHNPHVNTIFIVDEASMIGEGNDGGMNLLQDLVMYVYTGQNCKLILLGDTAQLPPVGSSESPAMSAAAFKAMGLRVTRATITRTVRQKQRSGILYNATWLRRAMTQETLPEPQLTVGRFEDVAVVLPEDMEDELGKSFAEYGEDQTIIITRSNRRAVDFNLAVRKQIFDREEFLSKGDRLLISKNNYYWPNRHRKLLAEQAAQGHGPAAVQVSPTPVFDPLPGGVARPDDRQAVDIPPASRGRVPYFLANGEVAVVEEILTTEVRDMIEFADVTLWLPDSDSRINAKIVLDSLTADTAGLPRDKVETIGRRTLLEADRIYASPSYQREALRNCPYFNALQVKYAYAVTCHKAQGGQWDSVFVDMGYIPPEAYLSLDFYRWLYTSVTRATRRLFLLNPTCRIL
jgi:exodeoxyribonuclease-5